MNVSHEQGLHKKDEWITPPDLIKKLGVFDLDPCSPINRPWDTAINHYSINDNGLLRDWIGSVYCNPPYSDLDPWIQKAALHGNCIVLIFSRTDTNIFHEVIFKHAYSVLFIKGRIKFYHVNGEPAKNSSGAPSVLIAFDKDSSDRLRNAKIKGFFMPIK